MTPKTRFLALASMVAALTVCGQSPASAACSLVVAPIQNNVCQQDDERLAGYGVLSCAKPRNHDQRTFCGAVYGYEQHWCARIGNAVLRNECLDRTE